MTRGRFEGQVYLWRYSENTRNYPGAHLTADGPGCRSLSRLLDQLAASRRGRLTIQVTRPTPAILSVPSNRHGTARWSAPSTLRVTTEPTTPPSEWILGPRGEEYTLTAGDDKLHELAEAVRGILRGEGDFPVSPEDASREDWARMSLWIWWKGGAGPSAPPARGTG